ncbi:hypothetical protein G9A89_016271 [Geosiphon pyriformis]|nr:hypothetical protein G9A89_016271 [Geosiphon pyriformis]
MTNNTTYNQYSYISQLNSLSPVNSTSTEMSPDDLEAEYEFWSNTEFFDAPTDDIAMLDNFPLSKRSNRRKLQAAATAVSVQNSGYQNLEFMTHQLAALHQTQQPSPSVSTIPPFIAYGTTPPPIPNSPLQQSMIAIPSPPHSATSCHSPTASNFPAFHPGSMTNVMLTNNNLLNSGVDSIEPMSKRPRISPISIPHHQHPQHNPHSHPIHHSHPGSSPSSSSRQSSVDSLDFSHSIPYNFNNEYEASLDSEFHAKFTADEDKRRRNTAASARFRVKKKMREQALERTAKDMTTKAEVLEGRVKELELEIKWLRGLIVEKDARLLDIKRPEKRKETDGELPKELSKNQTAQEQ